MSHFLVIMGEYVIIIYRWSNNDLTVVLDRAYLKKVLELFIFFGIFLSKSVLANLTALLALFDECIQFTGEYLKLFL